MSVSQFDQSSHDSYNIYAEGDMCRLFIWPRFLYSYPKNNTELCLWKSHILGLKKPQNFLSQSSYIL